MWLAIVGIAVTTALSAQEPTRTPTPARRLSGGFGRPRATPVASKPYDGGQGFSDVVHAAHESREAAPAEAGTLTIDNRSLVKNSTKGKVSSGKSAPTVAKPVSTPVPPVAVIPGRAGSAADAGATGGGEAYWKQTADKTRTRVVDDKARVVELQAAVNKLENDFYAWDDGQYRDRVIKPAWDKAKSELAETKSELVEAEKALTDLPEKARQAGAMPGWIRE